MKRYLTKLVFNVRTEEGSHLFEEQTRLLLCASSGQAFEMAVAIGKSEEGDFVGAGNSVHSWHLAGVAELTCIDDLADGALICTGSGFEDDADSYLDYLQKKQEEIRANIHTFA